MINKKGFTIIELVVVMAIIVLLYGIIMFSVSLYMNKGKDSAIYGNLATLIPAGEVYYNYYDSSYVGFCASSVVENAFDQMPANTVHFCNDDASQAWAACARGYVTPTSAYCVDSRGVKREIPIASCTDSILDCD